MAVCPVSKYPGGGGSSSSPGYDTDASPVWESWCLMPQQVVLCHVQMSE